MDTIILSASSKFILLITAYSTIELLPELQIKFSYMFFMSPQSIFSNIQRFVVQHFSVSGWSSFLHVTAWVYKFCCMRWNLQSLWMCEWSKPYPTQVHIRYIYKCLILNGSKNHLLHPNKPSIVWWWCIVGSIGLRVFVSFTWWVSSIMSHTQGETIYWERGGRLYSTNIGYKQVYAMYVTFTAIQWPPVIAGPNQF